MKKILLVLLISCQLVFSQNLEDELNKNVSVNFKSTPMTVVLKIMSSNYGFNYVMSQVGGEKVTVSITNVPLKNALNSMLLPLGYHYFVQDGLVIIKKIENTHSGELGVFIYKCKYRDNKQLIKMVSSSLSPVGSIAEYEEKSSTSKEMNQRSNLLIVKDIQYRIDKIKEILEEYDKPVQQLLIEVKLVERVLGDNKNAGINWPTRFGAKTKSFEPKDQQAGAGGSGGQQQEEYTGWMKTLPELSDDWQWGVVAVEEMELFVEMLRNENNSKIVANPKVATENNSPAVVNIATSVPVPQITRSPQGDMITYEEKEVASYIEVLPVINEDNSISMTVHPRLEEIIGYSGTSDYPQPIIARREVKTKITVKNGEALVLGGLIKETESKVVNKVFLLGDIPVLGYLFRHYTMKKEKSDLLIVITPKILEQ